MGKLEPGKLERWIMRNKYVLPVLVLGLALLLLPKQKRTGVETETRSTGPPAAGAPLEASGIPLDTESERLAALLGSIRGVGEAKVLLSGQGAVVVCSGGDDAAVCLDVTRAVSVYTGLGTDRIIVMKGNGK